MSHLSVLLVEDDPIYASIARTLLDEQAEQAGETLAFHHVTTLSEAITTVGESTFDCALVDLGLPDARGADSPAQLIIADPDLPVVVLSADRKDETLEAVRRSGAKDYVMKGSNDEGELLAKLRAAATR